MYEYQLLLIHSSWHLQLHLRGPIQFCTSHCSTYFFVKCERYVCKEQKASNSGCTLPVLEHKGFLEPGIVENSSVCLSNTMVLLKRRFENISDTTTDISHKVLVSSLCCGGYHLPRSDKRRVALIGWVSFPHLLRQSLIVLRASSFVCSFVRSFLCLSVCLSVCYHFCSVCESFTLNSLTESVLRETWTWVMRKKRLSTRCNLDVIRTWR